MIQSLKTIWKWSYAYKFTWFRCVSWYFPSVFSFKPKSPLQSLTPIVISTPGTTVNAFPLWQSGFLTQDGLNCVQISISIPFGLWFTVGIQLKFPVHQGKYQTFLESKSYGSTWKRQLMLVEHIVLWHAFPLHVICQSQITIRSITTHCGVYP